MSQKERLPHILEQIHKRYCSIFLSKLVLFDDDKSDQGDEIRHYDIECEAALMIFDFLTTKAKAIQMKAFHAIKDKFIREKKRFLRRHENSIYSHRICDTQRNEEKSHQFLKHFPSSTRFLKREQTSPDKSQFGMSSDAEESLPVLMNKIRQLQSRFKVKNGEVSEVDEESEKLREKLNKRRLILSKINQLENQLSDMLEEDESEFSEFKITYSGVRPQQSNTDRRGSHRNYFSSNNNGQTLSRVSNRLF